jgi:lipopolysaccharide exporter
MSGSKPPLAVRAAGGAAWTIATGVGSRTLGLIGTLALTYFVSRSELGEVSDAAVAVALANQLSTLGVGQYYVSRRSLDAGVAWHATVAHFSLGVIALGAVLALGHPLGAWMRAASIERFLPGLALSGLLDRISYMPERVLVRDMRFRVVGVCRTAGDLSYTTASVTLAALGFGGEAIVVANVLRSAVRLATMCASVPRDAWLAPSPLSLSTVRKMVRFGLPLSVANAAGFASRRVDNAIVSSLFGADVVGAYNLAHNVADVPAVQIGEQIGDVLFPSFARMGKASRRAALLRSTGLLALLTFPLAVGLGAVAPTTVETLLQPEWHEVAPMLAILSVLSVVRPVGWTLSSYLVAQDRPRVDAALEVLKFASLVGLLLTLGRASPLWACSAVGFAFGMHALASMLVVQVMDGINHGVRASQRTTSRGLRSHGRRRDRRAASDVASRVDSSRGPPRRRDRHGGRRIRRLRAAPGPFGVAGRPRPRAAHAAISRVRPGSAARRRGRHGVTTSDRPRPRAPSPRSTSEG